MASAYLEDNHRSWDHHIPELRFSINTAVQEYTIGMSPAELHLGRKIHSLLDKMLYGCNLTPSGPPYDVVYQLSELQRKANENGKKAQIRQLQNYNKTRQYLIFHKKDQIWVRSFPQSSAKCHFSAKLAPKWKGPYRIVQQMGPLNYRMALESSGENM